MQSSQKRLLFLTLLFMKKIEISTSAIVFNDVSELSSEDKMLMDKAIEAREKAYAPYSKFKVGAALLLENNQLF